jgi:hypothetical protein
MADRPASKLRISTIIHLILYTLLVGSLAGGIYWTYENMENEVGQRVHHAVKQRLKEISKAEAAEPIAADCKALKVTNLQLQKDLNETKNALVSLQKKKEAVEKQTKNLELQEDWKFPPAHQCLADQLPSRKSFPSMRKLWLYSFPFEPSKS